MLNINLPVYIIHSYIQLYKVTWDVGSVHSCDHTATVTNAYTTTSASMMVSLVSGVTVSMSRPDLPHEVRIYRAECMLSPCNLLALILTSLSPIDNTPSLLYSMCMGMK